jgi:hypothetical protein
MHACLGLPVACATQASERAEVQEAWCRDTAEHASLLTPPSETSRLRSSAPREAKLSRRDVTCMYPAETEATSGQASYQMREEELVS